MKTLLAVLGLLVLATMLPTLTAHPAHARDGVRIDPNGAP